MDHIVIQYTNYRHYWRNDKVVFCEECKWFATHFLSDANGNLMENHVCLNGLWTDDKDHICTSYEQVSE